MALKRTSHAVYDTKYHLVWTPKYRKWILRSDIRERVKEIFEEISEDFDFEIDAVEITKDHIHLFLSFPPRYSISKVVGILKSISASKVFQEFPEVRRQLWGGEFWEDGFG
jgi:putative transposase